jgi:uncharacterized protein
MRLITLVLLVLTGFAASGQSALAAGSDGIGFQSYVTPFPDKDRYRIYVFGDAFGKGVANGLTAAFASDSAADVIDKAVWSGGVARDTEVNAGTILAGIPAAEKFQIAVVIFGIDDLVTMRIDKQRSEPDTEAWLAEYERRIDSLLKAFKRRNVAIYWLGLPIMRGPIARANSERLNNVFRQKAVLNGSRYIDTWSAFADATGAFAPYGPDMTGKIRSLRLDNGIHMTDRGYEKLAHFAEREIRRDLAAARAEREIPLAGDETEQKAIRADLALSDRSASGGQGKAGTAKKSSVPDTPADNSAVLIQVGSSQAQPVRLELNRPAIPGAVIAHLRSTATKALDVGQTLSADLQGGLTALSSITSTSGTAGTSKSRLSLTQSPYYKVLVKGEVLPPKPGRADDFRWPRDEVGPAG